MTHQQDHSRREHDCASKKHDDVIFTGIQPTGTPHLGNYLGFIKPLLRLQRTASAKTPIYLCIADLHAISIYREPDQLLHDRRDILAVMIAAGIDPERTCLYFQGDVPEHTELAWTLNAICPVSRLMEMTSWKNQLATKSATSIDDISEADLRLGLLAYPVLQAGDILLYKSTIVPFGDDQSPHMALVKFIAQTFNTTHRPIFPIPQPLVVPSNRIVNLQKPTAKMSKSNASPLSRIYITDSPSDVRAKIQAAIVEPPGGEASLEITYDPILRPGLSNLLVLWSAVDDGSREPSALAELARKDAWTIEHLKKQVAEVIIKELEPVRVGYERIRGDSAFLRQVAERNKRVAQATARETMAEVRAVLGLNRI